MVALTHFSGNTVTCLSRLVKPAHFVDVDIVVEHRFKEIGSATSGLVGERHSVIDSRYRFVFLHTNAGDSPCAEFKLFSATCILSVHDATYHKAASSIDSYVGSAFPLVYPKITCVGAVP